MHMYMEYRLAGIFVGIYRKPVPCFSDAIFPGNYLGSQEHLADGQQVFIRYIIKRRDPFLGYDQEMDRSLGPQSLKSNDQIILINDLPLFIILNDLLERRFFLQLPLFLQLVFLALRHCRMNK